LNDSRSEGVASDARRCLRLPTIQKFEQRFGISNVILLRSPPASGKTSFGQVYEEYMKKDKRPCLRLSLLGLPAYEYVYAYQTI
jgi:hypothetical protein